MTKILNLARLKRKFDRLPKVAADRIRAGMEEAAGEVVRMMKSLAPVDSGALRDSIGWTWGSAPKGAAIVASVKSRSGNMTITIYAGNADAYYARFVEFGTLPHVNQGKFAGSENPGTSATPFFYVSWRANRKTAKRLVRKAVRDAAKQVAASS